MRRRRGQLRNALTALVVALCAAGGGCKQQNTEAAPWQRLLPVGAELAASGVPPISYVATPGDEFFVVDETNGYLISSGRLPTDEQTLISIDPKQRAVLGGSGADNLVPLAQGIEPRHRFSIWHASPSAPPAQPTPPGAAATQPMP
jgi:hypothetical protein